MSSDEGCLLGLLLFFMLLRAFYSACEHTIVEANDSKIKELAEHDEEYRRLRDFLSAPTKILNAFSVHKVFSSLCIGAVLVYLMLSLFGTSGWLCLLGSAAGAVVAAIVVSVFCDAFPKRMVGKNVTEKSALGMMPFVRALMILLFPLSAVINALSYVLGKLFGFSAQTPLDVVTEEEILMMVDAGNETGVIEESQREMINNIFEFGDVKVSEIMTHRTDIIGLDIEDKISDIIYLAINKGFSRMPVYEGSIDKIIGIIYVKDFLCLVGCEKPEEFSIKDFMREALYIPASNKCDEVFEIMTKKKVQMAVLVDEYGGTAGIVTMEDILEEIVGNIQDEYDEEEQDITEISEDTYIISGAADPEDVMSVLHVKTPGSGEYDTMNAMIVDLLGRIPTEYETPVVSYENIEFTVMLTEENWISKIKAVVKSKEIRQEAE
ncbi:MAG: HlyC/CorC family transporter [Ruminococcus sp.]|nr:HlyC/CorC family transporter [Ruminococcus sp.]